MTHVKRSTARRSMVAVAGIAAVAMVLAACSSGSSESASSAAPAASAAASGAASAAPAADGIAAATDFISTYSAPINEWPDITPLSAAPDIKGKTIVVIPIGDAIPIINANRKALEAALTKAGAVPQLCDGKFNPTEIANCLKLAADNKAYGVITMYIDYNMVPTAFDAATAAGVKVLVGAQNPAEARPGDQKTIDYFSFNVPKGTGFDAAMGYGPLALQGKDANVLFIRNNDTPLTTDSVNSRIAIFTEACPECKYEVVDFITSDTDKLPSLVSAKLVSKPDINAVVAHVDGSVPPVIQGIQAAGKSPADVKIYTISNDLDGLKRIEAGQQAMDAGAPNAWNGYELADAFMRLAVGDPQQPTHPEVLRVFTADNIQGLELTPEGHDGVSWYSPNDDFINKFMAAWQLG